MRPAGAGNFPAPAFLFILSRGEGEPSCRLQSRISFIASAFWQRQNRRSRAHFPLRRLPGAHRGRISFTAIVSCHGGAVNVWRAAAIVCTMRRRHQHLPPCGAMCGNTRKTGMQNPMRRGFCAITRQTVSAIRSWNIGLRAWQRKIRRRRKASAIMKSNRRWI